MTPGTTMDNYKRILRISIIIPVYRSESTIRPLVEKILEESCLNICEILLVNDASPDNTGSVCRALVHDYPRVLRVIELSRNFGEHNAVMAGLKICRGDVAVIMDDDFQNPPSEIIRLVECIQNGKHDVVY